MHSAKRHSAKTQEAAIWARASAILLTIVPRRAIVRPITCDSCGKEKSHNDKRLKESWIIEASTCKWRVSPRCSVLSASSTKWDDPTSARAGRPDPCVLTEMQGKVRSRKARGRLAQDFAGYV